MEQIWWRNISKAAFLIRSVADTLLGGQCLILTVPAAVPWKDTMMDQIRERLSAENNERSLIELDCPDCPAGKYLLDEFCKREKRAQYRPGKSYAEFLARSEGIVLNTRDLWIRISTQKQLDEWCSFISEYNKNLMPDLPHAGFVLELQEGFRIPRGISGMKHISFQKLIEPFDVYTFCALTCTENGLNERERLYLAQTVSAICGTDVELCALCMAHSRELLEDPAGVLQRIAASELHSDGNPIVLPLTEEAIATKLWESQIKVLFPILEQYRSGFIRRHLAAIESALPIENKMGEILSSPCDVELGMLITLTARGVIRLSAQEYEMLVLFRDARNTLAHLKVVPYGDAARILRQDHW